MKTHSSKSGLLLYAFVTAVLTASLNTALAQDAKPSQKSQAQHGLSQLGFDDSDSSQARSAPRTRDVPESEEDAQHAAPLPSTQSAAPSASGSTQKPQRKLAADALKEIVVRNADDNPAEVRRRVKAVEQQTKELAANCRGNKSMSEGACESLQKQMRTSNAAKRHAH